MTLNDFIARAVAFFDKAEPALAAKPQSDARVAELEGMLTEAAKTLEGLNAQVKDLTAKLETSAKDIEAKGAEITTLKASLEAEKKRVDETLAAQGVPPSTIPAGKPDEKPAAGKSILDQFAAISDPVERVAFYRKNKAAYDAAFKNQQ